MRRSTMKNEQMALLFSEATPYIQKYHGKTLVIKYGGNAMVNDDLKLAVMNDLVTLTLLGVRVVLVHGGGPAINSMLKKVGKESKFVGGLRYTDEETMGIVQQVLAGQVNKDLVALLKGRGVGLCGMDGHMIMCKRKSDVDLGYVGEIEKVNDADRPPAGRQLYPGHCHRRHGRQRRPLQHQRRHCRSGDRHCPARRKARQHDGYCRPALR